MIAPHLAADEEFRERFIAEARSAAAIEHEKVVPVYSAGVVDGVLYMAMRYVDGTDLRTVLAESGPLASAEAGLDRRGSRGRARRRPRGRAGAPRRQAGQHPARGEPGNRTSYLTDFGLTKGGASSPDSLTATGQWVGTIDYVAPEQIKSGRVDARTDVYALGCVLYEALTGSVPFPGTDMQKMWGHVNERLPFAGDERLAAVVAQATEKTPARASNRRATWRAQRRRRPPAPRPRPRPAASRPGPRPGCRRRQIRPAARGR